MTRKTLTKEVHRLLRGVDRLTDGQVTVTADWEGGEDNLELALAVTPNDGPYHGGIFDFQVKLNAEYPTEPPAVTCKTEVYHPNIDTSSGDDDNICLSLFSDWSESNDLEDVVQGLLFMFYNPNIEDPLSPYIASTMDYEEFEANVRESLLGNDVDGYTFAYNYTDGTTPPEDGNESEDITIVVEKIENLVLENESSATNDTAASNEPQTMMDSVAEPSSIKTDSADANATDTTPCSETKNGENADGPHVIDTTAGSDNSNVVNADEPHVIDTTPGSTPGSDNSNMVNADEPHVIDTTPGSDNSNVVNADEPHVIDTTPGSDNSNVVENSHVIDTTPSSDVSIMNNSDENEIHSDLPNHIDNETNNLDNVADSGETDDTPLSPGAAAAEAEFSNNDATVLQECCNNGDSANNGASVNSCDELNHESDKTVRADDASTPSTPHVLKRGTSKVDRYEESLRSTAPQGAHCPTLTPTGLPRSPVWPTSIYTDCDETVVFLTSAAHLVYSKFLKVS